MLSNPIIKSDNHQLNHVYFVHSIRHISLQSIRNSQTAVKVVVKSHHELYFMTFVTGSWYIILSAIGNLSVLTNVSIVYVFI